LTEILKYVIIRVGFRGKAFNARGENYEVCRR